MKEKTIENKQFVAKTIRMSEFEVDEALMSYIKEHPTIKKLIEKGFNIDNYKISYELNSKGHVSDALIEVRFSKDLKK